MVVMKRAWFIALTALVMGACAQDKTEDIGNGGLKIYASIEQENAEARVQLNDRKQTVWTAGDQIVTAHKTEGLLLWQFDGNTGDRSGSFSLLGRYPVELNTYDIDNYYALYPKIYNLGSLAGTFVLLSTQSHTSIYSPHSYGLHANAMFGTSEDGQHYKFQNLHGYLRLSLTGERSVRQILLQGNGTADVLAGIYYFNPKNIDEWGWYDNLYPAQVIDCGEEGVQLSGTPTDFYYAIPPVSLAQGITVTITFTDGSTYTKMTSKPISIKRNTIQPMAVVNTDQAPTSQVAYITYMSKYITAPRVNPSNVAMGTIDWGDGTVTSVNDLVHYYYYDDEPSHTVTVTVENGAALQLDKCSGVTKIDLSNF